MKWTSEKPIKPGWYWYEDENYGPAPVYIAWTGFRDMPHARQLEVEMACGEEMYQPCGEVKDLEGLWSNEIIVAPDKEDS